MGRAQSVQVVRQARQLLSARPAPRRQVFGMSQGLSVSRGSSEKTRRLTVLILGGYGTFGGRLAQLLAYEERLTLIVAGRSLQKAQAFCAPLKARATLVPRAFDREGDAAAQLVALKPNIVV